MLDPPTHAFHHQGTENTKKVFCPRKDLALDPSMLSAATTGNHKLFVGAFLGELGDLVVHNQLDVKNEDSVRLDVWLDVACIYKTRSQAQTACKRGRVEVNGDHGKPHRAIRPGDTIRIKIPGGRRRIIEVLELESVNVSRARARELYADHTPPPTAEEIELRKMQRLSMPPKRVRGTGAPKKRERRELRKIKEEWE